MRISDWSSDVLFRSLVKIPDFFEAECLGFFGFAQHARITHAGQVTTRYGFDTQELGIQEHDFGGVFIFASDDFGLDFCDQVVGHVVAQLVEIAAVPYRLDLTELSRSEEHTSELQSLMR